MTHEGWSTNHLYTAVIMCYSHLEITGALTLLVLLAYGLGIPVAEKCLFISHGLGRDSYSKGMDDIYFIGFWVVAFTFLRAASMLYLYHPLAKVLGVSPLAKRQRLAEQGFVFTYSATFWTLGMVKKKKGERG
jgi:acyl-CoA-dependent ceramide synthase